VGDGSGNKRRFFGKSVARSRCLKGKNQVWLLDEIVEPSLHYELSPSAVPALLGDTQPWHSTAGNPHGWRMTEMDRIFAWGKWNDAS
jgi:hypothetical protein